MRLVNLKARGLFLVVCVAAAAVLSGCVPLSVFPEEAAPSWHTPTPLEAPAPDDAEDILTDVDITRPMPDNPEYDEWVNWREGRDEAFAAETQTYITQLGESIGISGMESPSDFYLEGGWIAVAPFGDYCIAAINVVDEQSFIDGEMSLSILSRINLEAEVLAMPTTDYQSLASFAEYYRSWCAVGGPFPGTPPGSDVDVTTEDTSTTA
jgi:hypothetical protein